MSLLRYLLPIFTCIALVSQSHGGVLRLEPVSQSVDVGAPFKLSVFFDDASISGLFASGFRILVDDNQFDDLMLLEIEPNSDFEISTIYPVGPPPLPFPMDPPAGSANLTGISSADVLFPIGPLPGTSSFHLADIELKINSAAPGTTFDFTASVLSDDPNFVSFLDQDFNPVPVDTMGNTQFAEVTVNGGVVPEPGSILIWAGLVGAPILVRRRQRSKVVAATA